MNQAKHAAPATPPTHYGQAAASAADPQGQQASQRWVVMGVSGAGKSAIGAKLAARLGIAYVEGDDFHTPGNVAKMAAGIPLDDDDRREWLQILQRRLAAARASGESLVLSCSSLKRQYRDLLRQGDPLLMFVYLHGERDLIAARMRSRAGHFMPPTLLDSQLRDLEPPQPDERAIPADIQQAPDALIDEVVKKFTTYKNQNTEGGAPA